MRHLLKIFTRKEAYNYFVELEFKNMLKRFDNIEDTVQPEISQYFKVVEDFGQAEDVIKKAEERQKISAFTRYIVQKNFTEPESVQTANRFIL